MRTSLIAVLLLLLALPAGAQAGTAAFDGKTFAFQAAPGEANTIVVEATDDCEGLAVPCLKLFDSPYYPVAAPPGCVEHPFLGIRCPLPGRVVLVLGDQIDIVSDWDGPSTIYAGPGHDVIRGRGGNDVLAGEDGFDDLLGGRGDDELHGGPGEDTLEAYLGGFDGDVQPSDSAGADRLHGGPDNDTVSYEARTDPLTVVLDDRANDGGANEGDLIAPDVEVVKGGSAADRLTGDARANVLHGRYGDDELYGGAGDDELDGNAGGDLVEAGDGADKLYGGGEDDVLVGGRGADYIWGEYPRGCEGLQLCVGGADAIHARDGTRDYVDCGDGTDQALIDRIDTVNAGCEVAGGPGSAGPCRGFKGARKRLCTRLSKCRNARCRATVAKRARRRCRGSKRCLRTVGRIVRATASRSTG